MGLAEAERFSERCEIVAAVPDGPLRERFEKFAEVVPPTPSLPTWPATPPRLGPVVPRSLRDAPRLAKVIRESHVDAVITCSTVLFTPVVAARLARVPVIVHAREWPVTRLGRAVFVLHRWFADAVVAISADVEDRLAGSGARPGRPDRRRDHGSAGDRTAGIRPSAANVRGRRSHRR